MLIASAIKQASAIPLYPVELGSYAGRLRPKKQPRRGEKPETDLSPTLH